MPRRKPETSVVKQLSAACWFVRGSRRPSDKLVDHAGKRAVPTSGGPLAFGAATARDEALQKRRNYLCVPVVPQGRPDEFHKPGRLDGGGKDVSTHRVDTAARPAIPRGASVRGAQQLTTGARSGITR